MLFKKKSVGLSSPPRELHLVKLALDGEVFVDHALLPLDQLEEGMARIAERNGAIVYFRERPYTDPSPEAEGVFKRIAETAAKFRLAIMLGQNAPSEWGELAGFQIELCPGLFRIFLTRGQPYFAALDTGANGVVVANDKIPDEPGWFRRMEFLISSDRLVETPKHAPDRFMQEESRRVPSLHVGAIFSANRGWTSWWPREQVPANVESLLEDCRDWVLQLAGPKEKWKTVDPATILKKMQAK